MRDLISQKLKEAMLAKEPRRVATHRLILAAIKDRDIQARTAGEDRLSDEEILGVLMQMIKQRRESAQIFSENGRPELAEKEEQEISIIQCFLPPQLNDDEVKSAIKDAIKDTGAKSIRDIGKVMGILKERYSGSMDFARAGSIVRDSLK